MLSFDLEYLLAESRWDDLKEYLNRMEEYFGEAEAKFNKWANEQVKKLTPTQQKEFYEEHVDEYSRYGEEFPRILRNSYLVSIFSLLEYEVGMAFKRLKDKKQIAIGWKDLRGDMVERAKLYCKLAGVDFPFDGNIWQEINDYSKVRNCIVHKNGLLRDAKPDLIQYLTDKSIISEYPIAEITLTKEFCEKVINTTHIFFKELYDALSKM